ncbi:MAG: hypothetical protein M1820_006274 [Bogoriella megaspora]|nr:MAG: hypothetical protein M1820_006274 [Bogoriella megaspora]
MDPGASDSALYDGHDAPKDELIEPTQQSRGRIGAQEQTARALHHVGRSNTKDLNQGTSSALDDSIVLTDAVGRKIGMAGIIEEAFDHVEFLDESVKKGQYDLFDPAGNLILPSVWEEVVQPGWSVKMTMWPIGAPSTEPVNRPPHGVDTTIGPPPEPFELPLQAPQPYDPFLMDLGFSPPPPGKKKKSKKKPPLGPVIDIGPAQPPGSLLFPGLPPGRSDPPGLLNPGLVPPPSIPIGAKPPGSMLFPGVSRVGQPYPPGPIPVSVPPSVPPPPPPPPPPSMIPSVPTAGGSVHPPPVPESSFKSKKPSLERVSSWLPGAGNFQSAQPIDTAVQNGDGPPHQVGTVGLQGSHPTEANNPEKSGIDVQGELEGNQQPPVASVQAGPVAPPLPSGLSPFEQLILGASQPPLPPHPPPFASPARRVRRKRYERDSDSQSEEKSKGHFRSVYNKIKVIVGPKWRSFSRRMKSNNSDTGSDYTYHEMRRRWCGISWRYPREIPLYIAICVIGMILIAMLLAGCTSHSSMKGIYVISFTYQSPAQGSVQASAEVVDFLANVTSNSHLQVRTGYFGICATYSGQSWVCKRSLQDLRSVVSSEADPLDLLSICGDFQDSVIFSGLFFASIALAFTSMIALSTFPALYHVNDDYTSGSDIDVKPLPTRTVSYACLALISASAIFALLASLWQHTAAVAVSSLIEKTGYGFTKAAVGANAAILAWCGFGAFALLAIGTVVMTVSAWRLYDPLEED